MSLMSDVTRQVKHPPTCTTTHHSQGRKSAFFSFFEKCVVACSTLRCAHTVFWPCLPIAFRCSAFVGALAVCSYPDLPSRGLFRCSAHA